MQDFFGQQEQARRNTVVLMALFICAVIVIILAVYLAVTVGLYLSQAFLAQGGVMIHTLWDFERFIWITGITTLLVAGGSIYRSRQLQQGGGAAVAEMLGGRPLPAATDDPLLIRLRNVVEEMAIASGVPAPPVYLMQQQGINAFAAGYGPRDAVIAVTRGAVDLLTRDELQGVVAHEFSHILNGDTKLKMHLMGLLFGITLISDSGILLMTTRNSTRYTRRDRSSHPAVIVIGFLLFLVGTIGVVFADLIKRAVSRQREFLADAAAVQFTRNAQGIADALKVIGGFERGSQVNHAATQQASHFFFCNALKSWNSSHWWMTHPPLVERIRRLDPGFRGAFAAVDPASRSAMVATDTAAALAGGEAISTAIAPNVDDLMQRIGNPDAGALSAARTLVEQLPDQLSDCAHDPCSARAVVYALLLDRKHETRKLQFEMLRQHADQMVFRETLRIHPLVERLCAEQQLPLLEIALSALKQMSKAQFDRFRAVVQRLIAADFQVGLFELLLQRMLFRHLYPVFLSAKPRPVQFNAAGDIADEAGFMIAVLIEHGSHANPNALWRAAMQIIVDDGVPAPRRIGADMVARFDRALEKCERAAPAIRRRLLKAALVTILADGKTAADEIELLRIIADALDAPMPQIRIARQNS